MLQKRKGKSTLEFQIRESLLLGMKIRKSWWKCFEGEASEVLALGAKFKEVPKISVIKINNILM